MREKFQAEWRNPFLVKGLTARIARESRKPLRLMEVCGTHTVAVFHHGLRRLLPPHIELISGPGCPVCVTPVGEIDSILELARRPEVIIATFGDLLRIPGSGGESLSSLRSREQNVRLVYSSLDALELALQNPSKKVVFCAVGFETTAPNTAAALLRARRLKAGNFFVLPRHKLIPPAMEALLAGGNTRIDGFICPGHVSVIIGWEAYRFIGERYQTPAAIAGFEPADILMAVLELVRRRERGEAGVSNCYPRAVTARGNGRAQSVMEEVFAAEAAEWRGLGEIAGSGLRLRPPWREFDAVQHFRLSVEKGPADNRGCACGDVLKGVVRPTQCPSFADSCTPESPRGPCMVSSEGSCAAYFKYGGTGPGPAVGSLQ